MARIAVPGGVFALSFIGRGVPLNETWLGLVAFGLVALSLVALGIVVLGLVSLVAAALIAQLMLMVLCFFRSQAAP